MFFLAYIVLPLLILGNLILAGINLSRKKVHPIGILICLAIPPVVYYLHTTYFPAPRQSGFIVFIRYPEYVMMQTVVNAIIFLVLKFSGTYEKNPRRNYYRDKENEPKEDSNNELLDN